MLSIEASNNYITFWNLLKDISAYCPNHLIDVINGNIASISNNENGAYLSWYHFLCVLNEHMRLFNFV